MRNYLIEGFNYSAPILIFPLGKFYKDGEEREMTEEDAKHLVRQFETDVLNRAIPVNVEHEEELGAIGFYKRVYYRPGIGVYAIIEWTPLGESLLRQKRFKYFSPELAPEYIHPTQGEEIGPILVGGAVTNYPFHLGLTALDPGEAVARLQKARATHGGKRLAPAYSAVTIFSDRGGKVTAKVQKFGVLVEGALETLRGMLANAPQDDPDVPVLQRAIDALSGEVTEMAEHEGEEQVLETGEELAEELPALAEELEAAVEEENPEEVAEVAEEIAEAAQEVVGELPPVAEEELPLMSQKPSLRDRLMSILFPKPVAPAKPVEVASVPPAEDFKAQAEQYKAEAETYKARAEALGRTLGRVKAEIRRERFTELAEEFKTAFPMATSNLAALLDWMEKQDTKRFEAFVDALRTGSRVLEKSNLFTEIGSGREGGPSNPVEIYNEKVKSTMAERKVSLAQAQKIIDKENPDLARDYLNEMRSRGGKTGSTAPATGVTEIK